jgi:hypothetical protein
MQILRRLTSRGYLCSRQNVSRFISDEIYHHKCFAINLEPIRERIRVEYMRFQERDSHISDDGELVVMLLEYRHFLYLKCLEAQNESSVVALQPPAQIGLAWQAHVENTNMYTEHCESMIGKYIHCNQEDSIEPKERASRYHYTLKRYAEVFGKPPPPKFWPKHYYSTKEIFWQEIDNFLENTFPSAATPTSHKDDVNESIASAPIKDESILKHPCFHIDLSFFKWHQKFEIEEYRRFLYLLSNHRNEHLMPSMKIDKMWHSHVLRTERYVSDCQKMAGRYIHHVPSSKYNISAEEKRALAITYNRTLHRYKQAFGMAPPPFMWPRLKIPEAPATGDVAPLTYDEISRLWEQKAAMDKDANQATGSEEAGQKDFNVDTSAASSGEVMDVEEFHVEEFHDDTDPKGLSFADDYFNTDKSAISVDGAVIDINIPDIQIPSCASA